MHISSKIKALKCGVRPSAKIHFEKRPQKQKITKSVRFLQEITFFYKKCQFFTNEDDFLIKYAYFLKNKSTKVRGYGLRRKLIFEKRPY